MLRRSNTLAFYAVTPATPATPASTVKRLGKRGFSIKLYALPGLPGRRGNCWKAPAQHPYPASGISPHLESDAVYGCPLDSIALVAPRSNRASDYAARIPARRPAGSPANGPRP